MPFLWSYISKCWLISYINFSSSIPGQMIWEGLGRHWYGDVIFCKMFKFLQTFSLTSSNYMLVAIAMDRHRAITRPLTMPGSPYKLLSSAWLFSLLPSLPCLFIFKVELRDSQPQCVSDFTFWPTFWKSYTSVEWPSSSSLSLFFSSLASTAMLSMSSGLLSTG